MRRAKIMTVLGLFALCVTAQDGLAEVVELEITGPTNSVSADQSSAVEPFISTT